MPGSFDSIGARAAEAIVKHLSDTDLAIGAGTVRAVWREPSAMAFDRIDSNVPQATIRLSDYPSIARGTTVTRSSVAYKVIGVELDGYGLARLQLELAV
jgi:hypothetical protein